MNMETPMETPNSKLQTPEKPQNSNSNGDVTGDLHAHAAKYFARPEPVQPVTLEEGGNIIGGVIFIRGERDYEMVRSLFKTRSAPVSENE